MTSGRRSAVAAMSAVVLLSSGVASAPPTLGLEAYTSGFTNPVAIVQDPTDPAVQFVVEQRGRIRTVVSGVVQPTDFLDLRGSVTSGGERGLLGLAFSPDAAATGRFFVNYTDLDGHSVGASVTGGHVYRGLRMAALYGRYFFADFITGRVWSARVTVHPTSREGTFSDIADHPEALRATAPLANVSSFGVD